MEDFRITQLDNRVIVFILNLIENNHRTDELKILVNNIENNIDNENFIYEIFSDNENIPILDFILNSIHGSNTVRNIRVIEFFSDLIIDRINGDDGGDEKIENPIISFDKNVYSMDIECAICLTGFISNELIYDLCDNKHIYHKNCLDEWKTRGDSCPVCRKTI